MSRCLRHEVHSGEENTTGHVDGSKSDCGYTLRSSLEHIYVVGLQVPLGAILEIVYYRYLYFLENGQVLYALSATPPHEMFPRFRKVYASGCGCDGENDGKEHVVWGSFTVQGKEVKVEAKQSWQYVRFTLDIDLDNAQLNGRFGWLTFVEHVSSSSGDFDAVDCVNYDVPTEPFRFVKDRKL